MSSTHEFQAEIQQLMHLIIHSFYSVRDIFIRELVSNSSDALDKLRVTSGTAMCESPRIRVFPDKDNKKLYIMDNGIGMTKEEMITNLGTIAHSGTKVFAEALKNAKDASSLIGQFGVGFYSAFLVAHKVVVYSRSFHAEDEEYHVWTSSADGTFEMSTAKAPECEHWDQENTCGTCLVLHMKDEETEFLEEHKLRQLVREHSQFVQHPIELMVKRTKQEEIKKDEVAEGEIEEITEDEENPKPRTIQTMEWDHINVEKAIWLREDQSSITDDEYLKSYRAISGELHKFVATKHISGEGTVNFKGMLFVPKNPQRDLYDSVKKKSTMKLYVRQVFVSDQCFDLIPEWLEFMYGVIDSEDIPLNVSREILQGNAGLKVIGKHITKKSIELLKEIMDKNDDTSEEFFRKFSRSIKFGVNTDTTNRPKLLDLLRYESSETPSGKSVRSLSQYVQNMKDDQENIYYISGEHRSSLENSPFMSKLKEKGFEVLFMLEPIDDYMMNNITEYNNKKFVNITREGLDFGDDNQGDLDKKFKPACDILKSVLGDKVMKVKASNRVIGIPCIVSCSEGGMTANQEKVIKSQALKMGGRVQTPKRVLEINPDHGLVQSLNILSEVDEATKSKIMLMYDIANVSSGFSLENPETFAQRAFEAIH